MIIEIMAKDSDSAHAIDEAIKAGTDYDSIVVFRSDIDRDPRYQYTVRVANKKDIPITY